MALVVISASPPDESKKKVEFKRTPLSSFCDQFSKSCVTFCVVLFLCTLEIPLAPDTPFLTNSTSPIVPIQPQKIRRQWPGDAQRHQQGAFTAADIVDGIEHLAANLRGALTQRVCKHFSAVKNQRPRASCRSPWTTTREFYSTLRLAASAPGGRAPRQTGSGQWKKIDFEKNVWASLERIKIRQMHTIPLARQAVETGATGCGWGRIVRFSSASQYD